MTAKTLRAYSQNEIKMREIDRRRSGRWHRIERIAARERKATRERIAARTITPKPLPDVPFHQAERGANIDTVPSGSEVIHCREVLDLLPVIEDQTFDPVFDGWGSLEREQATGTWLKAMREGWQRDYEIRVSPSRSFTCAIPTHENSTAAAGSNGLRVGTAAVVSVKATGRQVPKVEPEGAMPHPADLTEKVSAGASEAPAIPDLAA